VCLLLCGVNELSPPLVSVVSEVIVVWSVELTTSVFVARSVTVSTVSVSVSISILHIIIIEAALYSHSPGVATITANTALVSSNSFPIFTAFSQNSQD